MLDKQVKKQTTKKSKKDLDDKFLTPTKFSQEIERLVKTSGGLISYIEAVVTYCSEKMKSKSRRFQSYYPNHSRNA